MTIILILLILLFLFVHTLREIKINVFKKQIEALRFINEDLLNDISTLRQQIINMELELNQLKYGNDDQSNAR